MSLKFSPGDQVNYFPDHSQQRGSGGDFVVVRAMPVERGEEQRYRIKNAAGIERIVAGYQLALMSSENMPDPSRGALSRAPQAVE